MEKINKEIYKNAIKEVVEKCKNNPLVLSNINFIVLLGSVREKEYVLGYSDLDLLFILKSDISGSIDDNVVSGLKEIAELLTKKYQIKIAFLIHTVYDFNTYVDYEYLRHYSWGKILFGRRSDFNQLFSRLLSQKKLSIYELRRQILINIIHARFNLVRKYVSFNKYNTSNYPKELLKLFIDNIFEISDWRLIAEDLWSISKKDIVRNSLRNIESEFNDVISSAYLYRKNWNKLNLERLDVDAFFKRSLYFINDCIKQLIH